MNVVRSWQKQEYPSLLTKELSEQFQKSERKPVEKVNLPEVVDKEDKPCFLLKNVLTVEECQILIERSEKEGYEGAESYCYLYNNRYNDRLNSISTLFIKVCLFVSDDKYLADVIWERTKEYLPETLENKWKLSSLNPRWRFCKYTEGHYFGGHVDGLWTPHRGERSFLTYMIYLNGKDKDYTGGCTTFLEMGGKPKLAVEPEPGLVLCFLQADRELYHEGSKLLSDILRSDVMYTDE